MKLFLTSPYILICLACLPVLDIYETMYFSVMEKNVDNFHYL